MKKLNTQSAFPILIVCLVILIFVPSASGLFSSIGNLITELTTMKISRLEGVSSGIYVTPDDELESCDWRYGFPHKMHWPQLPDFGDTGMDVDSSKCILADDFKCTSTGPINDIHFWASFYDDILPIEEPNSLKFEIKIYSDIPASADSASMPGDELWSRTFYPGDYSVRKINNRPSDWYNPISLNNEPNEHRLAFQYNFCVPDEPFIQSEGTIYWLSIKEIRNANDNHRLGWKTTTKKLRWNDNAVLSQPGTSAWNPMYYPKDHAFEGESINLAFSITDGMQGDRLHDLGDAPDSTNTFPGKKMLAYSDPNIQANYPTIFWTLYPPFGPIHWQPEKLFYLGKDVSFESGADTGYDEDSSNNLYPPTDLSNRDGADDGLKLPLVLPHCQLAKIPFTLTTISPMITEPIYLNVWCDWNRDGDWDDIIECIDGRKIPEWAVQNTTIIINFAGTVDLDTPEFLCWNPQTGQEPDPLWLRISVAEKPWSTSYQNLTGNGGSGPDEGYEYGETEDYQIYPKQDPNSTLLDWADSPDSVIFPAYPTIASNNGAYHVIGGPWLGDANDKPDAEYDGQPDPNALGDDLNIDPSLSIGVQIDDENGVTIPPLIPGYPADITLEVSGGGGIVQAWIDYNSNTVWEPHEEVYNNYLAPGMHVISFIVPSDANEGQSFARFRISREGNLEPTGPAKDGEVEDYEVLIKSFSPYTKWVQLPDVTPHGIDIRIDSNEALRRIADDFECTSTEKLTDVHFWGSWKKDEKYDILRINLSIYEDDPVTIDNPYSKPKPKILWQKDFLQGQFKESLYHEVRKPGEWWWDPVKNKLHEGADKQIWKIDIDIDEDEAFTQKGTENNPKIYWLAIRVDTNDGEFGWKTRRWPDHFMDDAVWDAGSELPRLWKELRYPKKHPYYDIEKNSVDMAFQLTFTQDTGLPTMRPVSLTQCPAVKTRCPSTATQCPPVNTKCPAVATNCPPVQTQCMAITVCQGSSETICPAVLTECPVVETTCPFVETQCYAITVCQGSSETICPAVYTHCPVVETECPPAETVCPPKETQCPIAETKCPFVETKCYAITVCQGSSETICPAVYTQCPIVETECPSTETKCVAITVCQGSSETICPAVYTKCPTAETECPPSETACPPVDTKCPEEATRCPPVETQCPADDCYVETVYPASETKCPVVDTQCPTSQTKCPVKETTCPTTATKCPTYDTRCPAVDTECPAQQTACPTVSTECPPVDTQCPADDCYVETVYPASETKCPVVDTQCPTSQTKCPVKETTCPTTTTKCPTYDTRCPAVDTECPAQQTACPTVSTECPPVDTQCPADDCYVETVYPASETKCPVVDTQCPTTATKCPTYDTRCPAVATRCPEQQTICPVTLTKCPEEPTKCPVVATECPAEQTQCPINETQCPVTETKCPECIETMYPAVETKCPECVETMYPAVETKCPALRTNCPQVETQCPASQCEPVETVYPAVETKCPVVDTQCPTSKTKCPVSQTSCPVYDTWCNNVQTECPYNYTQCPPADATGLCPDIPNPPWDSGGTNLIISGQTTGESQRLSLVPAIQSCPAIEVKCPTIIESTKLLVSTI